MATVVNAEVKNSVFLDMFGQEAYQLQLFRTLHPEMTDVTAEDIQTVTLKIVITNHQYNDLAFLVKDRLMVFVEAQSTFSINILIRLLLYLAETLQEYIHSSEQYIHATRKLRIPIPEFYVIYTGDRKVPKRISLRRHFFLTRKCPIDLKARVITAETEDIIGQYIIFCKVMDDQVRKYGKTREAAMEAIRICRNRGVLKEYLQEREKEVIDIMMMLFDQEYVTRQYGRAEAAKGRTEGRTEGQEELSNALAYLCELGRAEEALLAVKDRELRNKILEEYRQHVAESQKKAIAV